MPDPTRLAVIAVVPTRTGDGAGNEVRRLDVYAASTVKTIVTGNGYRQEHLIGPGNRCSGTFSVSGLRNTITSPGTSATNSLVDRKSGK
ncbi:hypothetical protein CVN56_27055 [Rhodococcus sp. AQ5-07]|nr:hypothetical protein CVN56_27055 [Rhodococcus sp. AQ5-07]